MHVPVMLDEVLAGLALPVGGRAIDATLGGGGHAEAMLERIGPEGTLLGLDRDPAAIERVRDRLGERRGLKLACGNYADMKSLAKQNGVEQADAILMDLGVSSFQLDEAGRGFSFLHEGPLDMRMNPDDLVTAADLVNTSAEADLVRWFRFYGEEPGARRVARAVVARRSVAPFRTTRELAACVEEALGGRKGRRHPATRVFQALRMAVNRELEGLEQGVEAAIEVLKPGGRLAVISFHSLEDRIVKQAFREHEGRDVALEAGGAEWRGRRPAVRRVVRKALKPRADECEQNPRARSARLRIVERIQAA